MIVVQLVLRVYTQTTPFFEKQTIFLWKNKIHLYGAYITYVLNWINGIYIRQRFTEAKFKSIRKTNL